MSGANPKPAVLFLCTGNSARSLLAEALLRRLGGGRFDVYSAGTEPKGVNPFTLRVLEEAGVSTEGLRSKTVDDVLAQVQPDYLIAVCSEADRNCPAVPLRRGERLSWPFDDPAAETGPDERKLARFREVRDQIASRIGSWLGEEPWKQPPR